MSVAVIFGGNGFIGSFFAEYLISKENYSKVYLYDIEEQSKKEFSYRQKFFESNFNIEHIHGDVRNEISWMPSEEINLILNFAAVHREPGHEEYEYFETNLLGAENICSWADKLSCNRIIFTSSISPYGNCEIEKDENSIPVPNTPYGSSKLASEKIHLAWASLNNRKLIIVRPGVVFGPGEGGNVSRLVKAIKNRYFFYTGNRKTVKAGIYVKELCSTIMWAFNHQDQNGEKSIIFNGTMNPSPKLEDYVDEISSILNRKKIYINLPINLLIFISICISFIASLFKLDHPFSPTRIKKINKSNLIRPSYLIDNGYKFKYTLSQALRDWKKESPDEW